MREYYELAEFLVAAWRLADKNERIPVSHGILDHALREVLDSPAFPERFRQLLSFVNTSVGLRCQELPMILECAQESELAGLLNASYQTMPIKVDEIACQRILRDLDIDPNQAISFGRGLLAQAKLAAKADGFDKHIA